MPETTHFSLWLPPRGEPHERLARAIRELSVAYGTPGFYPHVTLLGGIHDNAERVAERTRALARQLAPLEIELAGLATTGAYYRCLFAEAVPSETLMSAHGRALEAFGIEPDEPYRPHLSLVYGDLERTTKERIIARLGDAADARFTVDRIDIIKAEDGPPEWDRIASIPFGQGG